MNKMINGRLVTDKHLLNGAGKEIQYVEDVKYLENILLEREVVEIEEKEEFKAVYGDPALPWAVLPVVNNTDGIKFAIDSALELANQYSKQGKKALTSARGTEKEIQAKKAYYPAAVAETIRYLKKGGITYSATAEDMIQEAWLGLEAGFKVWNPEKGPIGPVFWVEQAAWRQVSSFRLIESAGGMTRNLEEIKNGNGFPLSLDVPREDGDGFEFDNLECGFQSNTEDLEKLTSFIQVKLSDWYGKERAGEIFEALLDGQFIDSEVEGLLQLAITTDPEISELAAEYVKI